LLHRVVFAAALSLGLCLSGVAGAAEIKPWTGAGTPALVLASVDGRSVDLSKLRGRVVLINFWATWCEPCRDEMPSLSRLRDRLKNEPFDLLTVNFGESASSVTRFMTRLGLSFPVLLDPEKKASDEWKVRGLPMTFLVDARGTVRFWTFGEHDWNDGVALATVQQLVAEARRASR
jgi:cytochrome c biogenesis protein CcmG, thiol:disulfide interchange protein DsbE